MTVRRAVLLAVLLLASTPMVSETASAQTEPGPGTTTEGSVTFGGGEYSYLLHTPASHDETRPAPLVVVVHGCQTTADQQMRSSLFNQVAAREGFVVLYVDVDLLGQLQPGPANQCWKFPYPPAWKRGGSDAGAIAAMTQSAMADRAIDPERVYIVGMSAGGLMTSIQAAAYPDLYAAAGVIAAAGYADWPCFTTGIGIPVELSAQLAHLEMGPRARIVPRLVMGGTADEAFPPECVVKALQQGLRTNNLVLSGSQTEPISLEPAAESDGRVPGGHEYEVSTFVDPDGCLVGEQWIIDGLAHSWPGGTTNPDDQYNNDTKAPSAAEVSWAFFEQFSLSGPASSCAAGGGPPASVPPAGQADRSPAVPGRPADATVAADRAAPGTLAATGHGSPMPVAVALVAAALTARRRGNPELT